MKLVHGLLFIIAASSVESQNLPNDMLQDNHLISNGMTDGLQKHHKKTKYKEYTDSRCRTDEGKKGKTGEDYDTYNYIPNMYDQDDCEEKCSSDPSCTGYEFKKYRVCEIWHAKSEKQIPITKKELTASGKKKLNMKSTKVVAAVPTIMKKGRMVTNMTLITTEFMSTQKVIAKSFVLLNLTARDSNSRERRDVRYGMLNRRNIIPKKGGGAVTGKNNIELIWESSTFI
eukprot:CAMPEP_0194345918 /NCGR_PEP_ID=MMETSP0171-20130528/105131_1 /TAXON_ID=218684 /ORGANISM="Corethron pennatum, Strain L29A3" /LENGTH=228 /DNA_ID=CAMNT_0039112971 /DNA_START=71 /DNA_END=758 /DNA_ORIENTATION=+